MQRDGLTVPEDPSLHVCAEDRFVQNYHFSGPEIDVDADPHTLLIRHVGAVHASINSLTRSLTQGSDKRTSSYAVGCESVCRSQRIDARPGIVFAHVQQVPGVADEPARVVDAVVEAKVAMQVGRVGADTEIWAAVPRRGIKVAANGGEVKDPG